LDQVIFGENTFLRRIPVINRQLNIYAYQIEFIRLNDSQLEPVGLDPSIFSAVNSIDPSNFCGMRPAIFTFDRDNIGTLLFNEKWRQHVIMDVPAASLPQNSSIQKGPKDSKKLPLCITGYTPSTTAIPDFPSPWYVKVDVGEGENELVRTVKALKVSGATVIATSVNTHAEFDLCMSSGADLFMGEFYSQPVSIGKKEITPNHTLLLELSAQTANNGDIKEIESIIKKNPDLTFGLMNLTHSAFFSRTKHVASIRQAIAMLGYDNIHKWVSLMLFSIGQSDISSNPIFEKALIRARTMELAVLGHRSKGLGSTAYIVGVFSVIPSLFNVDLSDILSKANFVDEIKDALLERSGTVGSLLNCVEAIDNRQYDSPLFQENSSFSVVDILKSHTAALIEKNLSQFGNVQASVTTSTADIRPSIIKVHSPLPGPRNTRVQRSWFASFLLFLGLAKKQRPDTKRGFYVLL
jgi:hypothetical protein